MNGLSKEAATLRRIGEESAGQRVDNYLTRLLKGVPKSHIYRILRSGEVRVNSRRVQPEHRLEIGDRVRVPPVRTSAHESVAAQPSVAVPRFQAHVVHEDEALLVIDKPAGIAVHGGSGVAHGVIERLRRERPQARFLELVHRLDRDTSGILVLAKKRSTLTDLHRQLREGAVQKFYLALVAGRWPHAKRNVKLPLHKYVLGSGERRVKVEEAGQEAHTIFRLQRAFGDFTLVEAELKTGRTHQIRVHLAHLGYPIAGDDKYGDFELNRVLLRRGLKRMFLHACRLTFEHPLTRARVTYSAPLPPALVQFLEHLRRDHAEAL
jgi:23S rRNA pseudouridine955/2504/2580 synthase